MVEKAENQMIMKFTGYLKWKLKLCNLNLSISDIKFRARITPLRKWCKYLKVRFFAHTMRRDSMSIISYICSF